MRNKKLIRAVELFSLMLSFLLLIPPVSSNVEYTYSLLPMYPVAILIFSLSTFFSYKRSAENILTAIIKIIFFMLFGFIIHLRANMG